MLKLNYAQFMLLLQALSVSALSMTADECEFICCLSSMGAPLPRCVPPKNPTREWGWVDCTENHCLVLSKDYNKYSPPPPTGFDHPGYRSVNEHDPEDPCPAKDVTFPTNGNDAVEVRLEIEVNSISDIKMNENSFTTDLKVKMYWIDPNLDLCSCHHERTGQVETRIKGYMEDKIWIPDLTVWEHISYERKLGLTGEKLSIMHVKDLDLVGGGVVVDMTFDMKAVVSCSFNATFYPFDRNICKVHLGSYSHFVDEVFFMLEKAPVNRLMNNREYSIDIYALSGVDALIHFEGDTYGNAGFKFQMIRRHEKTKKQFKESMRIMVLMALGSTLIPTSAEENFSVDRTSLLSGSIISSVLIFQAAIKISPSSQHMSLNPLLLFIIVSLFFIMLAFLEFIILSIAGFKVSRNQQIDLAFLVVTCIAYLVFVEMHWDMQQNEAEAIGCHNEK